MTESCKQFQKNIEALMVLDSIYLFLTSNATAFDITEILRAQYILIVSAMDYYIHEVVREGLLKSVDGEDVNSKLKNVSIPLHAVKVLLNMDNDLEKRRVLDASIRDTLTKYSYQSPRNIENALSLLGYRNLFTKMCEGTTRTAKDVKDQLDLIILRRNKIAHEADINHLTQEKELMDRTMTTTCLTHVTWIVERIDHLVESQ